MTRAVGRPASAEGFSATAAAGQHAPRPRRAVHPWAWWTWAIGAAVLTMLTGNALLLVLLAAAVTWVVVARRGDASRARSLRTYLVLALFVVAVRLGFQVLLGGFRTGHVLFTLPSVRLPAWFAGIQVGGPVTAEALWATTVDAGRLALLLWCVGAANTLANSRRALRNLPHSLHRLATAVVIAVSVAPQLVESVERVRRARRLRGVPAGGRGSFGRGPLAGRGHAVRAVVVPVLEDAIERSMALAASMESRGFGRANRPTRHRPEQWGFPDWLTSLCGLLALMLGVWLRRFQQDALQPPVAPITWPPLTAAMALAVAVLTVPAWATPPPEEDA